MKVECAWCKKDLGEKEPLDNQDVTHSMCETCRKSGEFEMAIKRSPDRYLFTRNSQGELTEVIDKDTGRINQKSRSGWYFVD